MYRKRQRQYREMINKDATLERKKSKIRKVLSPLSDVTGDHVKWGRGDEIYRKIQEIDFLVPWKDDNDWMKNHKAKEKEIKLCELGKIVYGATKNLLHGGNRRRKKRTKKRRRKRTKKRRKSKRKKWQKRNSKRR